MTSCEDLVGEGSNPPESRTAAADEESQVSWMRHFSQFTSPYCGYTHDLDAAQALVTDFQDATDSRYRLRKTDGFLRKNIEYSCQHCIYFERASSEFMGAIPSDGVPFVIVGCMVYACLYKDTGKKTLSLTEKPLKGGCTSQMKIRQIVRFPEFKVKLRRQQRKASYELRDALNSPRAEHLIQEHRFYVDINHHHSDHSTAVLSLSQQIAPKSGAMHTKPRRKPSSRAKIMETDVMEQKIAVMPISHEQEEENMIDMETTVDDHGDPGQAMATALFKPEMAAPATVHQASASEEAEVIKIISGLQTTMRSTVDLDEIYAQYPWTRYFTAFTSPYSGYTTELRVAELLIRDYGLHMNTDYSLIKTAGTLRKHGWGERNNSGVKLFFEKQPSPHCGPIRADGVPFMVHGFRLLMGPSKRTQKNQMIQGGANEGYKSTVSLRHIVRFPEFKTTRMKSSRRTVVHKLRSILKGSNASFLVKTGRYYVDLNHVDNDKLDHLQTEQGENNTGMEINSEDDFEENVQEEMEQNAAPQLERNSPSGDQNISLKGGDSLGLEVHSEDILEESFHEEMEQPGAPQLDRQKHSGSQNISLKSCLVAADLQRPTSETAILHPWMESFQDFSDPYAGYTKDVQSAEAVICKYITHSRQRFIVVKNSGVDNSQDLGMSGPRRVYFSRPCTQYTHSIENDGVPFIITAHRQYGCSVGRMKEPASSLSSLEADHCYLLTTTCQRCAASIMLRRVVRFPEYKVKTISHPAMRSTSKRLRTDLQGPNAENIVTEVRYHVDIKPDHSSHDPVKVGGMGVDIKPDHSSHGPVKVGGMGVDIKPDHSSHYPVKVMESKEVAHQLLHGMNRLRLASQLCDITLAVGEARLQAHRLVLASASPLFASLFHTDRKACTFEVSGASAMDVLCVLDFLYTGQISLRKSNVSSICHLAVQLKINLLAELCDVFEGKGKKPSQIAVDSVAQDMDCNLPSLPVEDFSEDTCAQGELVVGSKPEDSTLKLSMDKANQRRTRTNCLKAVIPRLRTVCTDKKSQISSMPMSYNGSVEPAKQLETSATSLVPGSSPVPGGLAIARATPASGSVNDPVDQGESLEVYTPSQAELPPRASSLPSENATCTTGSAEVASSEMTFVTLTGGDHTAVTLAEYGQPAMTLTGSGHSEVILTVSDQTSMTLTDYGLPEITLTDDGQPQITLTDDGQPQMTLTDDGQPQMTLTDNGQPQMTSTDDDQPAVTLTSSEQHINMAGTISTYSVTMPGGETVLMEVLDTANEMMEVGVGADEEVDQSEKEEEEIGLETPEKPACEWCEEVFGNLDAIRAHVKRYHPELMYQCQHCLRKFATRRTFENHVDICLIGKKINDRYQCPSCSYNAAKLNSVVNHFRSLHKKPTKKCESCGTNFVSRTKYYEHMLKAHDMDVSSFRPIISCSECSFKTVRPAMLRNHQEMHTRQPASCPVCSKVFISTRTLKKHMLQQHCSDLVFACDLCEFSSKYKGTLESHQYRQHNLLPSLNHKVHSCPDCSQTFLTVGDLTKHSMQRHSKEKRFICVHCSKGFQNKIQLTIHERGHTGERPFSCSQCSYAARSRQTLETHIRGLHSDLRPYVCEYCGHATKLYGNLKKHKIMCAQKAHLRVSEQNQTESSVASKTADTDL